MMGHQYMCVGYSVFDEERMRQQPDRINMAEGEVHLPYCEGIEVCRRSIPPPDAQNVLTVDHFFEAAAARSSAVERGNEW